MATATKTKKRTARKGRASKPAAAPAAPVACYTVKEIVDLFRIGKDTVYKLVENKTLYRIPGLGRVWRISAESVHRWANGERAKRN